MSLLFTAIGTLGTLCFLAAYFLLQKGRLAHDSYAYLGLNLLGSLLLIASLCWDWNLAAFMLEAAWGIISAYGLVVRYRKDRALP